MLPAAAAAAAKVWALVWRINHLPSADTVSGAGCAGALELIIFHPVDTIAKRLMNNKDTFTSENWKKVIFQEKAELDAFSQAKSLFPGMGYAAVYKISQRVYKFGGQGYVKDWLKGILKPQGKASKTFCDGLAGSFMGVGEVVLLPFDVLKIKMQTNAAALEGMSFLDIAKQEGVSGLYRGASWTALRNAPGSFSLFGVNSFVKDTVFGVRDRRATFFETFCASTAGGVASVVVACPVDVIKTRLQSGTFGEASGMTIVRDIVREEGVGAFFKGSVPKVSMTAPKLIFSFTVAQWVADWFKHNA